MNHFAKSKHLLLTNFVCLYYHYRLGEPSVAPSSAGHNHVRQLIKSLGSDLHHGKRARRKKAAYALGNTLSWLLGAAPVQDQEER